MGSPEAGNTRLRSARQALGLRSQQQLADAVTRAGNSIGLRISITARTVRRWESDAPPWPHPDHQAAIEALFQRPITELGFTPPWAGAGSGTPRRKAARLPPPSRQAHSAGSLTVFPQRIQAASLPSSVVTDYISITSAHRHMYWTVPPAQLHDVVAAHVNLGARLVPSVPEAARRSLAAAVSESSLLAGRIEFFDLQNPAKGQASLVIALQAAQDAQDPLFSARPCSRTWHSSRHFPVTGNAPMRHATRSGPPAHSPGAHPRPRKCSPGSMPSKPR